MGLSVVSLGFLKCFHSITLRNYPKIYLYYRASETTGSGAALRPINIAPLSSSIAQELQIDPELAFAAVRASPEQVHQGQGAQIVQGGGVCRQTFLPVGLLWLWG